MTPAKPLDCLPPRLSTIETRLAELLSGLRLGTPCYAFQELPSTMDVAHQLARQGASEGACVWAETQTTGRGRAGRVWASPAGGIYPSFVLRPTRLLAEVPQLALVAGLATVQAIHEMTGLSATIRWPNDVFLHERKLAGILVETTSSSEQPLHVVVGIGINVSTDPDDLPEGAASLSQWTTPPPDRLALAAALFRHFEHTYRQWVDGGFGRIRLALIRWIGLFGQLVHITTAKAAFEGQAVDVDETGRLLVRLDSGIVRSFEVGDVTLLR